MLFSIIVPLYKVEKYIKQCIVSVLNQDFKDYELILVNDGSPDRCGEISDQYADRDSRIKVIHKVNGGLSDARNAGISIAKGDYIIFLDGDDYLEDGILTILSNIINTNNPDIITCATTILYPNGTKEKMNLQIEPLSTVVDREHLYRELSRTSCSYWSAGKNIYSREIIKMNDIKFKVGLIGAEDCDFFMKLVRLSENFIFLNHSLINYRRNREGSITESMKVDAILGQLSVFSENYHKHNDNQGMQKYFAEKFINTVYLLFNIKDENEINKCKEVINQNNQIIASAPGLKYKFARFIWTIKGYYNGSVLLRKINLLFRKR